MAPNSFGRYGVYQDLWGENRGLRCCVRDSYSRISIVAKRVTLPDFGIYFRTNNRSPIDFVCRETPNLLHDMVFLRSYLHDATFEAGDVRLKGAVLRIGLKRDRWELYKSHGELESIATRLIISPVLSLKWKSKARSADKFSVCDVYLGESFWDNSDTAEVVLSGFGNRPSQLRITVRDPFSIRLQDVAGKVDSCRDAAASMVETRELPGSRQRLIPMGAGSSVSSYCDLVYNRLPLRRYRS